MSETLKLVQALVARGEIMVSLHGYEELANDNIRVRDAIAGLNSAVVVEDYPTFSKGPCVLVLVQDGEGHPIHIVWVSQQGRALRRYSLRAIARTPVDGMSLGV